jgi:hypothetical protein
MARGVFLAIRIASGDSRHIAPDPLLPSAQSGRVFGTSDRTHGHHARRMGKQSHHFFAATVGRPAM